MIIPLLGFDAALNRIGYGGGYYDRTLQGLKHAIKIGVAFEFMKVERIPIDRTDIRLDFVVTESKIYSLIAQ